MSHTCFAKVAIYFNPVFFTCRLEELFGPGNPNPVNPRSWHHLPPQSHLFMEEIWKILTFNPNLPCFILKPFPTCPTTAHPCKVPLQPSFSYFQVPHGAEVWMKDTCSLGAALFIFPRCVWCFLELILRLLTEWLAHQHQLWSPLKRARRYEYATTPTPFFCK